MGHNRSAAGGIAAAAQRAVQSVLRSFRCYLAAEARTLVASRPGNYETRIKVARFLLQHAAARVAQAHPSAAGACWDELTAAAEMYGHIARCAFDTVAAEVEALPADPSSTQPGAAQRAPSQQNQQVMAQRVHDLDAAVALKLTSVLAVVLDAGVAVTGGSGGMDADAGKAV
ncbi:hypothetical protein GPECTOR_471g393 [Gonium pectorale]|uniref:Uncharacterized protein n=1 Tax=Gonium pectorale TaxID=33097 RepID=A0A150FUY6_GONPE|nr:hypothetical protein GPECTOR_471g393 [Gonium pectorale]|eukprot:KXZ41433.1 hypothetical protein GPECTOR_471g393 [Gonium pectorale]